jgi:hypothetical protein
MIAEESGRPTPEAASPTTSVGTVAPDADYHARFMLVTHLSDRRLGLLRAMAGAGECRFTGDTSCLMCSPLTLTQLARAVELHGPTLRRYAADVTAIQEAIKRAAVEWLHG